MEVPLEEGVLTAEVGWWMQSPGSSLAWGSRMNILLSVLKVFRTMLYLEVCKVFDGRGWLLTFSCFCFINFSVLYVFPCFSSFVFFCLFSFLCRLVKGFADFRGWARSCIAPCQAILKATTERTKAFGAVLGPGATLLTDLSEFSNNL